MAAETLRDIIRHGAEAYGEQTAFRYKVKKEIIDKTYNEVNLDSMAVSPCRGGPWDERKAYCRHRHYQLPVDYHLFRNRQQRQRGSGPSTRSFPQKPCVSS